MFNRQQSVAHLQIATYFFGLVERKTLTTLLGPEPKGTFLVMQSHPVELRTSPVNFFTETDLILCVKDDPDAKSPIKLYKIHYEAPDGYFLQSKHRFVDLSALIKFYGSAIAPTPEQFGICCNLIKTCPRPVEFSVTSCSEYGARWESLAAEFDRKQLLSETNFSQVWFGTWRKTVPVVMKTPLPGHCSTAEFLKEAGILESLQPHDHIVRLFAMCSLQEPRFMIMEFVVNGCLDKFLQTPAAQNFSVQILVNICTQIAEGMMHIASKGLVHRDLAARNILVGLLSPDKPNTAPLVKIADFGMTLSIDDCKQLTTGIPPDYMPYRWTAPEAMTKIEFGIKSDVWSYGILAFEVMSKGCRPYWNQSNAEVLEMVPSGYRMPCHEDCPTDIYSNVMLKCWATDPDARPTFEELFLFLFKYEYDPTTKAGRKYKSL